MRGGKGGLSGRLSGDSARQPGPPGRFQVRPREGLRECELQQERDQHLPGEPVSSPTRVSVSSSVKWGHSRPIVRIEVRHAFKHFTQTHGLGSGATSPKASWGQPEGSGCRQLLGPGAAVAGGDMGWGGGGKECARRTRQASVVQAGGWARGQQAAMGRAPHPHQLHLRAFPGALDTHQQASPTLSSGPSFPKRSPVSF